MKRACWERGKGGGGVGGCAGTGLGEAGPLEEGPPSEGVVGGGGMEPQRRAGGPEVS